MITHQTNLDEMGEFLERIDQNHQENENKKAMDAKPNKLIQ